MTLPRSFSATCLTVSSSLGTSSYAVKTRTTGSVIASSISRFVRSSSGSCSPEERAFTNVSSIASKALVCSARCTCVQPRPSSAIVCRCPPPAARRTVSTSGSTGVGGGGAGTTSVPAAAAAAHSPSRAGSHRRQPAPGNAPDVNACTQPSPTTSPAPPPT